MNLRKYARGKPCMIRQPGICNGDPATTVLCHLRMSGISGMGLKANDLLASWGCSSCHRWADTNGIDGRTALLEEMARTQAQILKLHREGPHCSTCECGLDTPLSEASRNLTTVGEHMNDEDGKQALAQRDAWYEQAAAKDMTIDTLPAFLKELAEFKHDYNTICYVLAAGATATAWALNRTPNGGITGFQAGAVMWEFLKAWNHIEAPARLLQTKDMLYPQNSDKFNTICTETWEWLQAEAKKKLEEARELAHPNVVAHWQSIRDGHIPFGFTIKD